MMTFLVKKEKLKRNLFISCIQIRPISYFILLNIDIEYSYYTVTVSKLAE